MLIEVPGMQPLERVGDAPVQSLATQERHAGEQGLADLLVGEDEAWLPALFGDDQPCALGLLQRVEQIVLLLLGERRRGSQM